MVALADTRGAEAFLACLKAAKHVTRPFDYWLLTSVPDSDIDAFANLPVPQPDVTVVSGRRETNNSSCMFFGAEAQEQYPVVRRVADGFKNPRTKSGPSLLPS